MKTLILKKAVLGVTFVIVALLLSQGVAFTDEDTDYAPARVIVKFKKDVADILEREIIKEGKATGELSLTPSLKGLTERYKVKSFKQLAPGLKRYQEKLKTLRYHSCPNYD